MKKVLIINGNPDISSFSSAIAESYLSGSVSAGAECKLVNLSEVNFSPILLNGYKKRTELEPGLLKIQEDILESDILVFVYPTWWGTYPALLKGFIDRVFLPGFAFKYRDDSLLWDKLLKGKKARLLVTMDTPGWYYRFIYRSPGHNSMKKAILGFCGFKPVNVTTIGPVKSSDPDKRQRWLSKVKRLGIKDVR